jgi:branched-chain amino acid transport system permease protein
MGTIITNLIVACSVGCIYGLVGFSLMAVYHCVNMVNFAQGDLVMIGAFLGFLIVTKYQLPYWLSFLVCIGVMPIIGLALWIFIKPLVRITSKPISLMLVTMGAGLILVSGVGIPTRWDWLPVPPIMKNVWKIWGITISPQYIIIIGATIIFVVIYWLFVDKTRHGWAFQTIGTDKTVAVLAGVRVEGMIMVAFCIASILGGIGGLLIAPTISPSANMGMPFMIKGFIAAMIGGIGNAYGPIIGGIILGFIEIIIVGYSTPFIGEVVTFCILLIFLLFWPNGILGGREIVKISRY